ncbi:DUF6445 family protein [Sphingosinicella sp. BN140058]|uniref:DUF6445 family protein n=1 Tax=Sphingosinicella sp. BN140058 TaxID=1892855 RepID=UPI0010100B63|nr:DUF6445 family protein [Sphingosinicella sp. BN140058]QAY79426.1 hypothetical protein ETR14_24950 [Sphingosinicella sp. BN140058]
MNGRSPDVPPAFEVRTSRATLPVAHACSIFQIIVMPPHADLFALSPSAKARCEWIGGKVPVILVDDLYVQPDAVRAFALELPFTPAATHYPGRIAQMCEQNPSCETLLRWARELATATLLSICPLYANGRSIARFGEVVTDFAIVDVHPSALSPKQRIPHVDAVPAFGLIYLNREERGGTLFFDKVRDSEPSATGYYTASGASYQLLGRIEPRFNRLAIYPGTVPHSGDIAGEWINGDARFTSPRLTQRLLFAP